MKTTRRPVAVGTRGQLTLARLSAIGLWVIVGVAAVSGPVALLQAHGEPGPPTKNETTAPGAPGFAERFVAAFVAAGAGTEDELQPFLVDPPPLTGVRPGALYAARTTVVDVVALGPRYWSVTVAAEVLAAQADGSYADLGTRFYTVGVLKADGGLVAGALPSEVSAPIRAPHPRLTFSGATVVDPDIEEAVSRFFVAYLAGDGELARYVAPGSALRPVRPASFSRVEISRVVGRRRTEQSQLTVQVLADVIGVDRENRAQRLQYALVLARREGRWEVRELLGPPPLASPRASDNRRDDR